MLKYVVQRVIALIAILFVVSFASFCLVHLLPGDPAVIILGTGDTPQARAALNHRYLFDRPIFVQYWHWLNLMLRGNFGQSFISQSSVASTLKNALPIDLELIGMSQVLAIGAAVPLALRAARKQNGVLDRVASASTFGLLSVPGFVLLTALVWIISIKGGWHQTAPNSYFPGNTAWANFQSLILPAIVIATGSFVVYFRVFRSDLIATFQEEFITMARSKGISRRRVLWRHAFRPSSLSLLGTIGINVGGLVAGTFIVEQLMGIPGLGFYLIRAIYTSDYILVQGVTVIVASAVVVINFLIDLCFGFIDPRISRD